MKNQTAYEHRQQHVTEHTQAKMMMMMMMRMVMEAAESHKSLTVTVVRHAASVR